jgi:hypothetical protein
VGDQTARTATLEQDARNPRLRAISVDKRIANLKNAQPQYAPLQHRVQ